MVWDRWRWLSRRVRKSRADEYLLDVGCGSGAFTIGMAKRGYQSLGLSWDEANQRIAESRARAAGASKANFDICDVRLLAERQDLFNCFDIIICSENIEHIVDDLALMKAMAHCLKPGGRLLISTPYIPRWPWSSQDYGPFPKIEDGRHVRRGYNRVMLTELCNHAGLLVEEISFISGPISQVFTMIMNRVGEVSPLLGWLMVLPFRIFPPLLDSILTKLFLITPFSIAIEAIKPRIFEPNCDG